MKKYLYRTETIKTWVVYFNFRGKDWALKINNKYEPYIYKKWFLGFKFVISNISD